MKMSTSPTRNTHFRGYRVPKVPPKSTKKHPKVIKNRLVFCIDFWTVCFLDFGCAKTAKKGAALEGGRGSWLKLRAQATQGRPQTSKPTKLDPIFDSTTSKMNEKRSQQTPTKTQTSNTFLRKIPSPRHHTRPQPYKSGMGWWGHALA